MVSCNVCGHNSDRSIQAHLRVAHGMNGKEYRSMFPGAPILSEEALAYIKSKNMEQSKNKDWRSKVSIGVKKLFDDPSYRVTFSNNMKKAQSTASARENHRVGANRHFSRRSSEQKDYHRSRVVESWQDPEKRERRVSALKEAHRTEEARNNHSVSTKSYYNGLSDCERQRVRDNLKVVWSKPSNRKKLNLIIELGLSKANSPEGRENRRLANLRPETHLRRSRAAQARLLKMPVVSSLNKKFALALNNAGLYPKHEQPVGPYCVDFLFDDINLAVEVDGDFWHANPLLYDRSKLIPIQIKVVIKDKAEGTYCANHGYHLIRFWETDINADVSACINKVMEVFYEKRG